MRTRTLLLLSVTTLSLTACGSMSRTDRAVVGGMIGAGAGAMINTSALSVLGGAAAGATIGALTH